MKARFAIAPLTLALGFSAYVAFHPGRAFAEPRLPQLVAASPFQASGKYTTDPAHTSVGFEIQHLGISKVQGRFTKTEGHLDVNLKDLTKSSVEFKVLTDSVDTAVTPRDNHLRTPDFFDVAKYPEISFKSTSIRKSGKGYIADGTLTIKAVSKKVSIPFKQYGPITDPWGGTRIGVVADPITINRQDYGIAYNDKLPDGTPAVANEVTIKLSLEATKDK